ncbi:hypothetical protein MKX03_015703, partial [Papaver bracteatum]
VEKEAIERRVLMLDAENAVLEVNGNRDEKVLASLKALEKQISDLTSKPVQCCGASGGSSAEDPWIIGQTVPSNWVRFSDLDVIAFSKNTPLTITKTTGGSKLRDDNTTNVQINRFYGGIFPIVVVDVAELTPNREDARFDPDVWGSYNNAGISYAARKPFASEIPDYTHKTC